MRSWFVTDGGIRVPAVSSEEMVEVDRVAVAAGLAILQMMEHAGRALAWHAMDLLGGPEGEVVVLAGGGGNGGGGLCAARHLANRGLAVSVVMAGDRLAPAASAQRHLFSATPGRVLAAGDPLGSPDLVIDALVGYGLREAPRGAVRDLIRAAGAGDAPILALDVPSGVDATTGATPGVHITARRTVTLALPKTGLDAVGDLWLADLGIPAAVYRQVGIAVPTGLFGAHFSVPLVG